MKKLLLISMVVLGVFSTQVQALPITFTGVSGSRSAEAVFDVSGANLVVTLTNTSTADVLVPTDVLTALFFTLASAPALTPVSAVLNTGSSVLFGVTDPGNVVGGEWAYKSTKGISSTGLGIFGPPDLFPGSNLQGPSSPDGLQYGITSAGDNPLTGNTPVTGTNALIKNSVVFTLSGLPQGYSLDLRDILNVSFQYGTALDEPNIPGDPGNPPTVPEPTTLLLLGLGLVGLAGLSRKIKKS